MALEILEGLVIIDEIQVMPELFEIIRVLVDRPYYAATFFCRAWREGFVRTFLKRDIPQLVITIPSAAMRRFWAILAHCHGQTLNASQIGRSLVVTDKTVRSYLDILTGTFMVPQVQPWYENIGKRQVKAQRFISGIRAYCIICCPSLTWIPS